MDFDKFLAFVTDAHKDQVDQAGKPYIHHLLRVADRTRAKIAALPEGVMSDEDKEEAVLVALGHDLIEDQSVTEEQIIELGGSSRLYGRIEMLSRLDPSLAYQAKIGMIVASGDIVVVIVKLSDNEDNNDPVRMAELPEAKREKLSSRYDIAHATLEEGLGKLLAARVNTAGSNAFSP